MKKNKKLIIIVNDLNFFCSHRLPIAEAAIKKNYHVIIGYGELGNIDLPSTLNKKFQLKHIPMIRGGVNIFKELKTLFYIYKFFLKEKPDIVHLVTIKPYLYGGLIARIVGTPSLVSAVSGLGTLFVQQNFKSKFLRFLLHPLYNLAFNHRNQTIIFQNKDDANLLQKWGVLKNNYKVRFLKGSGVRIDKFTKLEEVDGVPVICLPARLIAEKGIFEFISAARLIKKKGINARFLLAGELDLRNPSSLTSTDIKKINAEGSVEILGYQKDIPSLYSKSHIVCLPSYREGFPKALIEAAAACRAVITTDVPGCRDAIIPNKTGLLVPVRDIEALANAIQNLIENPKKRKAMGIVGRKLAERNFKIENIVKAHLKIYDELQKKGVYY